MMPRFGLSRWLGLQIEHVLAEKVQLCFIKLRRQDRIDGIFQILQGSAQAWNNRVCLDPDCYDLLQSWKIV